MTTLNFPSSPNVNDEYIFGSKTWIWNGTAWSLKQDEPVILLDLIKTVDGSGSGLDSDLLDGKHASDFHLASSPIISSVGAAAPLVSSGGTTPTISIPAATASVDGYMTSAYASKLDGVATGATANAGTVTSIVAGTGLSGGTITSSGTIALANTAVTAGSYTYSSITVDAQGRLTSASSGASPSAFPSGTAMLFVQTTAPTGWTKSTTHNDKALRIVSGTVGSGGSVAFSSAFASQAVSGSVSNTTATNQATTVTGTVNGTTLSLSQIPSHTHPFNYNAGYGYGGVFGPGSTYPQAIYPGSTYGASSNTASGGSGSHDHSFSGGSHTHTQNAHNHTFTGTAINLAVNYVDAIIAIKD